eukprot:Seg1365.4 transcript_id=Seg1365.4/GoldUCD/mRNA.D3Y31 product="WD repeat-containing protein 19" protein_id=Seg1365.4/GoldUCD/D3Y31
MKRVFTVPERVHGGTAVKFCWQQAQGNYLAATGTNRMVTIYDRHGELRDEIMLPGQCTGMAWDKDGDTLAIINDKNGIISLWDANSQKTSSLESGLRDILTFLVWAKTSQALAVGTAKGNLLFYNHQTSRKIPVLGKHTKRICCGAWNSENLLALGSEDKTITISNMDGDTLKQTSTRYEPSGIQFSVMKTDERSGMGETTVSLVVGKKTLYLYNINEPDNPIELAFQPRYGSINAYKWFGDGYIMIGFSAGYLVVISTHMKEIGQELFQTRDHKDSLKDIAISLSFKKAASCGDNCVKIHDLTDMKEIYAIITLDDAGGQLDKMEWTEDGQLLAVSTEKGAIHVYLTKLPILGDAFGTKIAYLTSLREVTVVDEVNQERQMKVPTHIEPSFMAIGPYHLAVGMNNRAWFCSFTEQGPSGFKDKEYLGTVVQIQVNHEYAAVMFENKVQIHLIDNDDGEREEEKETKLFPDVALSPISNGQLRFANVTTARIIDSTMTKDIYISSNGHNNDTCGGTFTPCKSIGYAVRKRAVEGDVVLVNGMNGTVNATYVETTVYINKGLSFHGLHGQPVVTCTGCKTLFQIVGQSAGTATFTVTFNNISFVKEAIGNQNNEILSIRDASLKCETCHFTGNANAVTFQWSNLCQLIINNSKFYHVRYGVTAHNAFGFASIQIMNTEFIGKSNVSQTAFQFSNMVHQYPYPYVHIAISINTVLVKHFKNGLILANAKIKVFDLKIDQSVFMGLSRGAINIHHGKGNGNTLMNINVSNSVFVNNSADRGGALQIMSMQDTRVVSYNCTFINNKAISFGGAVSLHGKLKVNISQSTFNDNNCSYGQGILFNSGSGAGGALSIDSMDKYGIMVSIKDCTFNNNTAASMGGTIYAKALRAVESGVPHASPIHLAIENSILTGPSQQETRAVDGDIMFSSAGLNITNVTMRVDEPLSGKIVLHFSESVAAVDKHSTFSCPEGFNMELFGVAISRNQRRYAKFRSLFQTCVKCPYNHYNILESSFRNLSLQNTRCRICPPGSTCKSGIISAKVNHWGYQKKQSGDIAFVCLPDGYGCEGRNCLRYNSCDTDRIGFLCAKCRQGFTESLLSTKCIKNADCKQTKFWPIVMFLLAIYLILFIFRTQVFSELVNQLLWFRKTRPSNLETPLLQSIQGDLVLNMDEVGNDGNNGNNQSNEQGAIDARPNDNGSNGIGTGFLKILFYFYQVESILKSTENDKLDGIISRMESTVKGFFNFNIAAGGSSISCALLNATPVSKRLIRVGFVACLLLTLLSIHVIAKATKTVFSYMQEKPHNNSNNSNDIDDNNDNNYNNDNNDNNDNNNNGVSLGDNVLVSMFEVCLLTYSVVVQTVFKLSHCIEINNQKYLYIQGNISCFQPWQYALMIVSVIWVAPFCLFIFLLPGSKQTELRGIFVGCFFPLPYLFYRLYRWKFACTTQHDKQVDALDVVAKLIHESLTSPFKKTSGEPEYLYWEGVYIARRLVLITILTFFQDHNIKLYTILFIQIAFLLHHVHLQPFNKRFLNILETISLTALVLISSMNLLHSDGIQDLEEAGTSDYFVCSSKDAKLSPM